jgi:hypothetical protein
MNDVLIVLEKYYEMPQESRRIGVKTLPDRLLIKEGMNDKA